jgi:SAM-dependent methyltransferase
MIFQPHDYKKLAKYEITCACCGTSSCIEAFSGDRYKFGLRTVVCRNCGLIFTNPRPDEEWFEDFYRHHYREFYENVSIPDEAYLSRAWISGRHQRNVELLSTVIPGTGRLLDIGCAEGTFLHLFSQRYPQWEIEGIEPSEGFSAFARTHYKLPSVATGDIGELHRYPENNYDLITANHILEHLLNPNLLFLLARKLLKKDGLLFIDIPDAESKDRGIGHLHIAHAYHFSAKSLQNFFIKHGFEIAMSQKGIEKPTPESLQVIGSKVPHVPNQWEPASVDAIALAKAFRNRCQYPLDFRIKRIVREGLRRLFR